MVYQILGGLLAIFFIFLLVMGRKVWRITHILCAFCAFSGVCTFLVFSGLVLKTHSAWRSLYVKAERALDKAEADRQRMLLGDPLAVEQKEESIRTLQAQLESLAVHRGRIWRGCTVERLAPNRFRARMPVVAAAAGADPKPKPHGLKDQDKLVVYVFAEAEVPDEGKVPGAYVGEFEAAAFSEGAGAAGSESDLSLAPTLRLDPDQEEKLGAAGTTLAIYELIPLDAYEVFAVWDSKENSLVGMEKDELKKYMPNQFKWPEERYQKFLETFYRFNRPAEESDPPENVWWEVKFLKDHEIQVDADAEQPALASNSFFDQSGRAVVSPLRRGEGGKVKFAAGKTAVFDQETAAQLVSQGICEKVKLVYRRQLQDFQHFFRELYSRTVELDDALRRAKRGVDELQNLAFKAQEQRNFHEVEKQKLDTELAGFRKEQADVTACVQQQRLEFRALATRLAQLYRTNLALAQELAQLQFRSAAQIRKRAAEAAAAAAAAAATTPPAAADAPATTPPPATP